MGQSDTRMTDTELLDAIEGYIMWPGPAAVEIYENALNQVVIKTTGGSPASRPAPIVADSLREALSQWVKSQSS